MALESTYGIIIGGFAPLVIFISIIILKYTFFKDKESKGIKWLSLGGIIFLLVYLIPFSSISFIFTGTPTYLADYIRAICASVVLIIAIIGSIKLISEIFE